MMPVEKSFILVFEFETTSDSELHRAVPNSYIPARKKDILAVIEADMLIDEHMHSIEPGGNRNTVSKE